MKLVLLTLLCVCAHLTQGAQWVFIVAGARGYDNYRHQANACHAYQIMLKHGIPRERIITMMYDDVANNPRNPFKGNIINEAGGPNVYEGVKIDYRGVDVTAQNFLKVLQGQPTNAGTGRVINSGPDDHIFVYYSDHGGSRFLYFPDGRVLYATHLNDAIMNMHRARRYAKMVFYVEACHSGSMFHQRLPTDVNVYAMTAANPWESSWSCCYDRSRKTCLGDQFSGNWMHDTEQHDIARETLSEQYTNVKSKVRMSHPQLYGDIRGMGGMPVGEFQGMMHAFAAASSKKRAPQTDVYSSWDVPYQVLLKELQDAKTTESRLRILHDLQVEQKARLDIRKTLEDIVKKLSPDPAVLMQQMKDTKPNREQDECYEQSVDDYLQTCTAYREVNYRLKDMHVFENLCNDGNRIEDIKDAIREVCSM